MINAKIKSSAKYVPDFKVSNEMLSEFVDTSDEWIFSRTGIKNRHISKSENTSDLCAKVLSELLKKSNMSPLEIDAIIIATITPDFLTPSTACLVQAKCGAENAFAFDINAACSGFVYALSMADKFIRSGIYKNIAVIGAETLSKIVDWNDRTTCVLFGDGAGGVILSQSLDSLGIMQEDLHSDGNGKDALYGKSIPLVNHFTETTQENENFVRMNGRDIFDFVIRKVPKSINLVLDKANLTLDDIKYIVPHQANSRIISFLAKKLKIDESKFYLNIREYGNTSAGSIPIALAELFEENKIKSGDKIILTGFGGGLTWGSLLIEI